METSFINDYFNLEQQYSIYFILFGAFSLALTAGLALFFRTKFLVGLAIGFAFFSLIEISVGSVIYLRSPEDMERVLHYADPGEVALKETEMVRMEEVMRSFSMIKKVEFGLLIAGFVCLLFMKRRKFIAGLGIGVSIQALVMLTMDILAEERAAKYITSLSELIQQMEQIC